MNSEPLPNSFRSGPDERGHFGIFGGRFVAETLMPLILDLEKAYAAAKADPAFQAEMNGYLKDYVGRPSPLYFAERLTEHLGGAKIYFKREELNHTGSHKVNNVLGQIMVARRMGKKRIIAETGAGQHGVATATLCARFGLDCVVYMGAVDVERQQPNVIRMEMLGAKVIPVQSGSRTLKDAMNEALRDWVTNVHDTFYCIGTVAGPHPYPMMVRDFQSVIGVETRAQMQEAEGRLPDSLVACIGGGSNAMGLFHPFLDDPGVEIFGVEAAGHGLTQLHAASIAGGRPGVLHGNRTYLLMDDDGQIQDAHSISAGLDYPGIGPEHSWLHETGRVKYLSATDDEALAAFQLLSRLEGIIPALEPAHAIAKVMELAPKRPKDHLMVVNLSGRGDKDVPQVGDILRAGRSEQRMRHAPTLPSPASGRGDRPIIAATVARLSTRQRALPLPLAGRLSGPPPPAARRSPDGELAQRTRIMTTRIDARFAELKKQGRSAFVTFLMAGDPDPATSLAIIKALPKAGADIIEIGMPFTDPMADGPAIQAAGLRALKAGMTLKKTLEMVRGFRNGRQRHAAGADGLLQSDLHLRRRQISRRCEIRRRRRPDHRRSAAGGRHRIVPAGDEGRAQFHPAGDADHRRQAPARGARQHVGLCLLRLHHRHHRQRQRRRQRRRRGRRPHQAAHQIAGLRRLRHPHAGGGPRHRRAMPMARWSARRWSMPCAAASMPKAAPRPGPSVRWPIWRPRWRRACGAPNRPRNKPQLRWRQATRSAACRVLARAAIYFRAIAA